MPDDIGRFLFVSGKPHVFPDESRFSKKPSGIYCIFPDDSRIFKDSSGIYSIFPDEYEKSVTFCRCQRSCR